MIPWTNEFVTELKPNEVFVFGSNEQGFHGAGAAGLACRGDSRNNWRTDTWFCEAVAHLQNDFYPELNPQIYRGKWARIGVARGYQEGNDGRSYAVATVTRPGAKRSISRRDIYYQLVRLWEIINSHPFETYLIPPIGESYAGWTRDEMDQVWEFLIKTHGLPTNVRFVGRPE